MYDKKKKKKGDDDDGGGGGGGGSRRAGRNSSSLTVLEKILVGTLLLMGCTALFFESLFYASHRGWSHRSNSALTDVVIQIWDVYIAWDPLFADPPLWLKVMCWIEVLLFGPLYFLSAYAIYRRNLNLFHDI